eukprot:604318-Ditylum_brightwellii.AAC.1
MLPIDAKDLYSLTLPEDIKRFSSYSIRVGACVLFHSSGKDGDFIHLQFWWKSDTFRLSLRNTMLLAGQHCQAVENLVDSAQVLSLKYIFLCSLWCELAQGSQIPVHLMTLAKDCNHSQTDRREGRGNFCRLKCT